MAVLGAGRMGRELVGAIAGTGAMRLGGLWARAGERFAATASATEKAILDAAVISKDLGLVLGSADVAIDFTLPAATPVVLKAVAETGKPLVCGVSGLDDALMRRMRDVSASVPVFYDRNMSFGVAVLTGLVSRAASVLGPEFLAEVHETHHV
ncbi:MAG TPA: hypothetical protein VE175_07415, partial [Woeseiaceae bacterium]|nr:hypothetical protein [Woeseiaceae bacterium]